MIRNATRPLFRVGNRWKTSPTRPTPKPSSPKPPSPRPSSPSLFSRPTKIIRRKYLPQSTKPVESQETTTSTSTTTSKPKSDLRFRFISRKPILRTTTPKKKVTEALFDQVSESSNQQSLEEDFEGGKTTELGELAIALQNIQLAPVPASNSSSTVLKFSSTTKRTNSKIANRLADKFLNKSSPQTTQRIVDKKPTRSRVKYSTTLSPILLTTINSMTKNKRPQPFQKIKSSDTNTFRPLSEYDYYDGIGGSVVGKIPEHSKVLLHSNGVIECLDQGNFPHPASCKKFISCAKMENGKVLGWEYTCPKNLSFDPIGGICNWSAGLGCNEQ